DREPDLVPDLRLQDDEPLPTPTDPKEVLKGLANGQESAARPAPQHDDELDQEERAAAYAVKKKSKRSEAEKAVVADWGRLGAGGAPGRSGPRGRAWWPGPWPGAPWWPASRSASPPGGPPQTPTPPPPTGWFAGSPRRPRPPRPATRGPPRRRRRSRSNRR